MDSEDEAIQQIEDMFKECIVLHRKAYPSSRLDFDRLNLSGRLKQGRLPSAWGHFSDVYKGKLDRKVVVAVKLLRLPEYSEYTDSLYRTAVLRFVREVSTWSRLKHVNVASMLGFTLGDGRIGLVSLWHQNGTLVQFLENNKEASRPDLILDVAEGTQYLHTSSTPVIHGDLKGANILVSDVGVARLADFGISKQMEDINRQTGFTTTGGVKGTTPWMAPELSNDLPITFSSDIYSCGGVFLEICCPGKYLYYYLSRIYDILQTKDRGEPPERRHYPEMAGKDSLWQLMSSCWLLDPSRRPAILDVVTSLYSQFGLRARISESNVLRPSNVCERCEPEFFAACSTLDRHFASRTSFSCLAHKMGGLSDQTQPSIAPVKPSSIDISPIESYTPPKDAPEIRSDGKRLAQGAEAPTPSAKPKRPTIGPSKSLAPGGGEVVPTSTEVLTSSTAHDATNSTMGQPPHPASILTSVTPPPTDSALPLPQTIPQFTQHSLPVSSPSLDIESHPDNPPLSTTPTLHGASLTVEAPPLEPQLEPSVSQDTESVDDDELRSDKEVAECIAMQREKNPGDGAIVEAVGQMVDCPGPVPPGPSSPPWVILGSPWSVCLSEYEQKEIRDYQAVHYIGSLIDRQGINPNDSTKNYGFDDETERYVAIRGDHIAYRYEIIDIMGGGTFGNVLHCRDHLSGGSVAIKVVRKLPVFHARGLNEAKVLDSMRKWDEEEMSHIIRASESFIFRDHLCIVMELLSINLYELIKANSFLGFTLTLIRRFTSQILTSLAFMREHRLVHCDLKPENVLLVRPDKSAVKVIDFGSSFFENGNLYTYIQSRYYRSPEVLLAFGYSPAIDMWSLGCIVAELFTGTPIFPGESEEEQLACIMEVLGVPDADLLNRSQREKVYFDEDGVPRPVINSKGRKRRAGSSTIKQALPCEDDDFLDFITKCLVMDPAKRMEPSVALQHPFIRRSVTRTHSPLPLSVVLSNEHGGANDNAV